MDVSHVVTEEYQDIWKRLTRFAPVCLSSEAKNFFQRLREGESALETLLSGENRVSKLMNSHEKEYTTCRKYPWNGLPIWTITILYAAKLFGKSKSLERMSAHTQTSAEIQHLTVGYAVEFLCWSQFLHYSISNDAFSELAETKINVLVGDYFITKFYDTLAAIRSKEVSEVMGGALTAFCENYESCQLANAAPQVLGLALKAVAILSGHDDLIQRNAETVGNAVGHVCEFYWKLQEPNDGAIVDSTRNSQCLSAVDKALKTVNELFPTETGKSDPFRQILHAMEAKCR